ncbi:MAG TPA: glucose 1-dehydrogenase [Dongiaceae bacterium]|jgi:NAD(P)-dependent dehydrogenase (short-subunit alcohol dehydrogenase family)
MNSFDLSGKAAIVTGAGSGLGRHFALTLARAGAHVAVMGRRMEPLTALAREIEGFDGRCVPIAADVQSQSSVRQGIAAAETELGPIAILVNNAGITVHKPLLDQTEEDWDRVVDTNLKGAWLVAQETARHMVRLGHGGSIVNIASVLGLKATGAVPGYAASKAGLVHLTRSMALELARHKIRVNALCPGYFATDMTKEFLASPEGEKLVKTIPQRRIAAPDELDGPLLLLASDAGAYMTGSVIVVDGGLSV